MTHQRARLTKSKSASSTTALQTLEITTTAVVTDNDQTLEDVDSRKQLHHHHYHHIRSPAFVANSSPLPSPEQLETTELLPSPFKCTSEAVVALQDAVKANENIKKPTVPVTECEILQSSFFSAILLIQWSNVIGPKVDKVWSAEPVDEKTQMMIARQVLNGEIGSCSIESKWVLLQSMICTAFLFEDPTVQSLFAIVLVVPTRYQKNFSQYFQLLKDRVPIQLVQPLIHLRKMQKRESVAWSTVLDYFTVNWLIPFVTSIMDLESVSLPMDCIKTSNTMLDNESKQMLDSPFFAKIITSHLQTFGSTVLIGNSLTSMNMMINTLALFLSAKERNRSSHARKHHHYMPDLYLQGVLAKDLEEMNLRIELAILDSNLPTTLVDMSRLIVKRTPLYKEYHRLRSNYHTALFAKLQHGFIQRNTKTQMNDWNKRSQVFEVSNSIAPMVQSLLEEVRKIPAWLREAYIKQWKKSLIKRALAMIRFIEDEMHMSLQHQKPREDLVSSVMNALSLYHMADFTIILTQAEKLKPGMADVLNSQIPLK
ncbi:hypothetical protein RMCBS344292_16243 [Rhizopus microsporus]|nr:hypothetical protein RMCBS344292_16243 [Rhizopus microsporus]